jgi:carboxymethylenebutenolidase
VRQTVDIKTDSGPGFTGYLALPEGKKAPGILVVQEIFGVNSHKRSVADLYAEAGFVVLAPDVFWRVKPGIEFGYTSDDLQQAFETKQRLNAIR